MHLNVATRLSWIPILVVVLMASQTLEAQQRTEKFSRSQKVGYLGTTSRSAMAQNVYERLRSQDQARSVSSTTDRVALWHEILLNTHAMDHTPSPSGDPAPLDQGGPTRTSRAMAMTQIAVFDAVNSFEGDFVNYNALAAAPANASMDAAIAYASHAVQVSLYPAQVARLDNLLASDVAQISGSPSEIADGQAVGLAAAAAIIAARTGDNSDDPEPDFGEGGRVADGGTTTFFNTPVNGGTTNTFEWTPDPLTPPSAGEFNLALGAFWGDVDTFAIANGDTFRSDPPPVPGSLEYILGFLQVRFIGASPSTFFSFSNPLFRFFGNYWGYDAVPFLGAPPRIYNQIAAQVGLDEGLTDAVDFARYLALVNVAQADGGIAAWDSKYFYNYWRPVTGIRQSDGVFGTPVIPSWSPVGVSVINTVEPITPTPPFPAYPSGHSTFGAATFEVMRQFFGDNTEFTFVSDEYNGEGVDPLGVPRPLVPVRFFTLGAAQASNGFSRIFNGVHWQWDNSAGQEIGVSISQFLMNDFSAFQPAAD